MVITSHSSVNSQRDTLWTTERIKETTIIKSRHERNKKNTKKVKRNNIVVHPVLSIVNPESYFPIGPLFINLSEGLRSACTASVINTANGNIGLTSAHCLTTHDPNDLIFSPGFDYGKEGPLGYISVEEFAIPYTHLKDPYDDDYALVKFAFIDPNGENMRLQDYTGGLGWRFDVGNNTLTKVLGYPSSGDLVNCSKDGLHLSSGAPMLFQYNRNEDSGYVYTVHEGYINSTRDSIAPIWDEPIFLGLLLKLS
ncbi:3901_t:CDS:2 [Gigaspora rosea]|nr:3901_t:CDS:2 [Gigaspora rosea]